MEKGLFCKAVSRFLLGAAAMGLLLFVPAGTLCWPGAWLLMGILFLPMFCAGLILLRKNPQLLKKRFSLKERQAGQRLVVALSGGMFVAGFLLAGLDFRLGWSRLPGWAPWAAAGVFLAAYLLYAEVLRENAYLSRTVEVQEGQRVVDTGLYGLVRHPMYSATILLFLAMPVVLGSLPALVPFLAYPVLIARRIRGEEALLERELPGYTAYKQRVRYRLFPFIW